MNNLEIYKPIFIQYEPLPFSDDSGLEALLIDHLEPVVRESFGLPLQEMIDMVNKHNATRQPSNIMDPKINVTKLVDIHIILEDRQSPHFSLIVASEKPLFELFGREMQYKDPKTILRYAAQTLSRRDVVFQSVAHGTNVIRAMLAEQEFRFLFRKEIGQIGMAYEQDMQFLKQRADLVEQGKRVIMLLSGADDYVSSRIHAKPYTSQYLEKDILIMEKGFEFYVDQPDGLLHQPVGLRIDNDGHFHAAVGDGWSAHSVINKGDGIAWRYMEHSVNLETLRKQLQAAIMSSP